MARIHQRQPASLLQSPRQNTTENVTLSNLQRQERYTTISRTQDILYSSSIEVRASVLLTLTVCNCVDGIGMFQLLLWKGNDIIALGRYVIWSSLIHTI